jgi:ABC-2 type transport system ATP-binding protein
VTLAISVHGLVKVYGSRGGIRAVDGIDLEVEQGEIFGLLGPNGAGKTTTVGVCTTRVLPTAGEVVIGGVDVVADPARAKVSIGVVTQFNTLDRSCTVWENLYFHCRFFGMGRGAAKQRADQLLDQFRLAERASSLPDTLSGGMAQRLQVARALAHEPRVLFLDEPTAGLDPQSRLALWEAVESLRESGITVLLTTHYMEEADSLCERVAIIDHGKILVSDSPSALKRSIDAETIVEMRLDDPTDDLADRLRSVEGVESVEVMTDGLRLFARSPDRLLPRVVEAAGGHGLRDVSVTEPTLETVFIRLTGRELRE